MTRTKNLSRGLGFSPPATLIGHGIPNIALSELRKAAADRTPVRGLTHTFYRYPARFSPTFVASAIEHFSSVGQIVLDPYMGGGTSVIEAYARRRAAIGCDLNSLAVFVTRAKVSQLTNQEKLSVKRWAAEIVPGLSYHTVTNELAELVCPHRTRNLNLAQARPAKKLIALAILSIRNLTTQKAQDFARAVLLNVAQWALNNRKVVPNLNEIRSRAITVCDEMTAGLEELEAVLAKNGSEPLPPILIHGTAADLPTRSPFLNGSKANLVVTSPPYPGIHILYHRWQIDGRKESPVPYWIADCYDGNGASYYNFADRKEEYEDRYFSESLKTLQSIRNVMTDGAIMIQMIAFSEPRRQLARYLDNMKHVGFAEIRESNSSNGMKAFNRIWRLVPSRTWYANLQGNTNSSREVVLLHRAT